jgi:hypothetical protein
MCPIFAIVGSHHSEVICSIACINIRIFGKLNRLIVSCHKNSLNSLNPPNQIYRDSMDVVGFEIPFEFALE